ncbi:hypothetical protein ILYODFUR_038681 [Ilyodon furcidens]|uniref:Uncharacterized protein n=1 Tax=Ilyodon furcidens TaxID=33524 RepID=A0ABV0UD80_9TELE
MGRLSWGASCKSTRACCLSPWATPEYMRVQPHWGMASRLPFGLGLAGSREEQPGHQALSDESRPQAWLQGGTPARHTRRRHVPPFCGPHEGILNWSLSDQSPRACLRGDPTRAI